MAEEHFTIGWNLQKTGYYFPDRNEPDVFYYGKNIPPVFRPPGYSFFIAVVLKIWGGVPEKGQIQGSNEEIDQTLQGAIKAIYFTQCFLLGLSTVILFLWMSKFINHFTAFTLALLFGCNPYTIILTGLLHYSLLHIFLTIISCYALSCSIEDTHYNLVKLILAGSLWGLTTLTRSTTLILPVFVFVLFLIKFRFSWQPILRMSVIFVVGMFIVVAPYTIRNYSLTKRIIPVNAQSGIALWAGTTRKLERSPNHYRWRNLWYKDGMPIYYKVTKTQKYSLNLWLANILELDDEFKREAFKNIYQQPKIFFYNFFLNFITFNLDINSVLIKAYQIIQDPDMILDKRMFIVGTPQNYYSSFGTLLFVIFIFILELLSLGGFVIAARKDTSILVPGLVYLCFCVAHSITHMDLMYYYIKIPFLFVFSGYFINSLNRFHVKAFFLKNSISGAFLLNILLLVYGIGLTSSVLFNN